MRQVFPLFMLFLSNILIAQSTYEQEVLDWQHKLNEEFSDPEESPLPKKQLKKFKTLEYFAIDEKYRIVANFEPTPFEKPITIPTTTDRLPVYVKYGVAHFELDGQKVSLPIYQNLQLRETEKYKDYLFAPFTDETNGYTTYGGGRYLDLKIPETQDKIVLDFNKAYNPYCAYSAEYSCPIPPRENDLALKIEAGVKAWEK
ncbi:MAG: DUF1684 domain-containing protein [Marinoscillum sp.]